MPPFLREGRSLNLWRVGALYMTQAVRAVKRVAPAERARGGSTRGY
jgi:hypothetical protein